MVVALHCLQRANADHPISQWWFLLGNGDLGVHIFFVISGFIITVLLLGEHDKTGAISFKNFYLRRASRILPAAYCYVFALLALQHFAALQLPTKSVAGVLFFYANYIPRPWSLDHFWTLAIEEQFYFVWPFVLGLCLKGEKRRTAILFCLAVIVACPILRVALSAVGGHGLRELNGRAFHTHADSLVVGCLLALLQGGQKLETIYAKVRPYTALVALFLFGISGPLAIRFGTRWMYPFGYTLNAFCIGFLLLYCIRNADTRLGKVLNGWVMVQLGILSYSIYLWQQVFLNNNNRDLVEKVMYGAPLPVLLLLTLVFSVASRWFVEQPGIMLRTRLLKWQGQRKRRVA